MKRKNTVVVNGNKQSNFKQKLILELVLLIILVLIVSFNIHVRIMSNVFAQQVDDFYKLNSKTIFSIDKIYLYSSAGAKENKENRPIWNLDLFQYTDIAVYINNNDGKELNYENSIKSMYIDNVKINEVKEGETGLYFKNINDFGNCEITANQGNEKFNLDDKKINDKVEYKVLNDGDIDYSKPEIFADCSNPITLEYINNNIKKNEIISDIKNDIVFDGNLLRRSGVILSDIQTTISFRINIINNYNQKFMANVYIEIPLEDEITGEKIYDGKLVKNIEQVNYSKFYRVS